MSSENLFINYPAVYAGTDKSEIFFMNGTPDLAELFKPGTDCGYRRFFVTDATIAQLDCIKPFIQKFDDNACGKDILLILGSGEAYKTVDSVLTIVKQALEAGFNRKDLFIGIGGGVICDTTAFAASIFKRGVKVQFVPTTLLAMVDASIGGKTGCDFENYKNMIGTFHPAQKLYYYPEFLKYLPENQYRSGLGEAFKTGLLFDRELYELFRDHSDKIKQRDSDTLMTIIQKCVKAKGMVVEKDFMENNIRATLNLGHTFAHALETIAGLGTITHGDAVAWGIGREILLSLNKEYIKQSFKDEVFGILEQYGWETSAVPPVVKGGGIGERFLNVMKKDKKNLDEHIRIIITKDVGETVIENVSDSEIIAVLK